MNIIISEKTIAGKRIAKILSNNKFEQGSKNLTNFKFKIDKEEYLLIPLRGHINTVDFIEENNYWTIYGLDNLIHSKLLYKPVEKRIVSELKLKRKNLNKIIIATDADREGEAIGLEAYNYLKEKNPNSKLFRAYFSALTEEEINNAFSNLKKLNFNFANSVFARQEIDLLWGAILTRYLSVVANRKGKAFLSAGRVQTPLLNLIVEREFERNNFKPQRYNLIKIIFKKNKIEFEGNHRKGKFFDIATSEDIFKKIENAKTGIVKSIKNKENILQRPYPFNTTSFLRAASAIGIRTNQAMSIAENLYQQGLISYPRTDNTVYPSSLDFKDILKKLSKYKELKKEIDKILQKPINPSRGKKKTTDHPPIHPVMFSDTLVGVNKKVYDLIVRRFLATLSENAITENLSIIINVEGEDFSVTGQRIIELGWKKIYFYSKLKEVILPKLSIDEEVKIKDKLLEEKETTPPPLYTEGALIKLMEDNNLGTKSTRPSIIQKLKNRKYITDEKRVSATKIAMAVCGTLNKYCELITKPKLTADVEKEMDAIAAGKKDKDTVVNNTRSTLKKVVKILIDEREKISKKLKETIREATTLGKCNVCGKDLIIRHGYGGNQFVGCTGYPKCKNTFPLPQKAQILPTGEVCEFCGCPIINVVGRRNYKMCLNPKCKSKEKYSKQLEEKKVKE